MKNSIAMIIFMSFVFTIGCESKSVSGKKEVKRKTLRETIRQELNRPEGEQVESSGSVCEILSKDFLLGMFPDANNFRPFSKEKPYPSCSYRFKLNGQNYKVGLTLVKKYASEKNLDKAVSYFKEKEPLNGIGKKAYYIPRQGQVSLYNGNYLAHIYVTLNEKGNKDLAIQLTKDLIKKLN